jgi:calcineurin-like phosphoesterase family protein
MKKQIRLNTHEGRVFIVSDIHYGHNKPFILNPRGYPDVETAKRDFRDKWLATITENDTVINIGDAVVGAELNSREFAQMICNLPCKAHYYVWGNHNAGMHQIYEEINQNPDTETYPLTHSNGRFVFLGDYAEFQINGRHVVVCHYPIASWNHLSKGGWMIHGHCHMNLEDDPGLMRLDASWDRKNGPIEWSEIEALMKKKVPRKVDHH